jgi:hypothetical protein
MIPLAPQQDTDAVIAAKKAAGPEQQHVQLVSDYFAAVPPDEIAKELQDKVDKYYNYVISSNLVELWRRSYRAYYGMRDNVGASGWGVFAVGSLIALGDQGEIVGVKVNHFGNLITHQLAMTCGQRPALECRAVNSDAQSLVAASLGDGIIEYFLRERKIERNYFLAIETCLVMGEGYICLGWDATAGKKYGVGPNGSVLYDGDLVATNFTPFQVIKDVTKNSDDEQTWYITHSKKNKYDLMTKYPDLARQIDEVSPDIDGNTSKSMADPSKIIAMTGFGDNESDDIPYMEFYHKQTDALPDGRYTIFINGDICLFDGPLPFREVPVYRVSPRDIIGTPFGWSLAFDILGLQSLVDKLYTCVSSNVLGSAVQNLWSPPNNGVNVTELGGNRSLIESMVKPEVLQLLSTAPEVYNYINKVEQVMETLAGISAINRGDMPSNDMSGSAMAFMASQAITFQSGLQSSANMLLEGLGTGVVNILKDFAHTPRLAIIAGKQNRPQIKSFQGSDLEPINNVICDSTSALSKTTAGKISISDNLLKAGMISTPQEYITLIKTGQMEPLTRGTEMENFLIQQENESLLQGQPVQALRIDKHAQHIEEHKTLLSSPSSRQDARLVQSVLDHITEHEKLAQMMQATDPAFLAATGQQPLPFPAPQAPPQPAGPPQRVGPPGLSGAPAGVAGTVNPTNPMAQQAQKVKQPHMPSLPKGADPTTQQSYGQIQQAQGH